MKRTEPNQLGKTMRVLLFALILLAFLGCAGPNPPIVAAPGATIGPNDRLPKILHIETPRYPDELKKAKVHGVVTIEFVLAKDGSVASAKAIDSPDPRLSALAEEAAFRWTFEPGIRNGVPAAAKMQVPITFKLE